MIKNQEAHAATTDTYKPTIQCLKKMKNYFFNKSICYPGVLFLHITVGKKSHNYQNVGFKTINYPTVLQLTERRDQDASDLTKEDYNEADRIFDNKKRGGKKKQIFEIS